jgi:protein-disulfide isomerase
VFPVIEDLRRAYAGRVTFNIRYFPLPSHANAMNAAIAVEAAAQQGKLERMYIRMYETQVSWGEQSVSHPPTFRGFAEDLGLDMEAFDAAVADPKTAARVERDLAAGIALGLQGTPTFFIDETLITPETVDDLRRRLDEALAATT